MPTPSEKLYRMAYMLLTYNIRKLLTANSLQQISNLFKGRKNYRGLKRRTVVKVGERLSSHHPSKEYQKCKGIIYLAAEGCVGEK